MIKKLFNEFGGKHGNVWDNEETDGFSEPINTYKYPFLSIIGKLDGVTDLDIYVSQDDTTYIKYGNIDLEEVGSGEEMEYHFAVDLKFGGKYIKLFSSNDVVATVSILGKEGK